MNKELKVFVVGGSTGYASWLDNYSLVGSIEEANLVFFTGGEDVFPQLYGEPRGSHTYHGPIRENLGMPARDFMELTAYKKAVELGIPMFGTCRGLQFLTVMNGGKLIQDVTGHCGYDHDILWDDGEITETTTVHHQMCYPYDLPEEDYRVLAVSHNHKSKHYLDGWDNPVANVPAEPEVIYYPKTKSLGVQGHPEMYWRRDYTNFHKKLKTAIKTLLYSNEETRIPVA
jgi:gamma-glutamyl-gamma-aminobutyrate hydrolase PuuD